MASDLRIRSETRHAADAMVRLMWRSESGDDQYASVKTIDFSESGLRIRTPHRLEPRTYVTLVCESLGLRGSACVRHCTRQGPGYIVGLEFAGGMFRSKPRYE